ncbi:GGDEF domain-containing protein [Terriglobus saanensis]|uniref:diguanylate cyclase n=1 Tax=Terriglobus saanensis (strain ATCC BAA-1853 / DSM 23119 / SP1PR4) TaxID=401053 RepID=E8V5I1_TERSS|nr:GGDEF domain-containing protein [Terriglobus saanensis]ADV81515.1 diguanylate cyclase [Terriglobus saanensis SP1PR4]
MSTFTELLPQVEQQIQDFVGSYFRRLRFPPLLEESYVASTARRRRKYVAWTGLCALLIFDLFLFGDSIFIPARFGEAVSVRLLVVTPSILLFLFAILHAKTRAVREASIGGIVLTICCATLYLGRGTEQLFQATVEPIFFLAFVLLNGVFRVDLRYGLVTSVLCLIAYGDGVASLTALSLGGMVLATAPVIAAAVLSLIGNFTFTRALRISYLQRLRSETQTALLDAANLDLQRVASRDALTGLNNRHTYDLRLQELFADTIANPRPISAIMVDIDHFKILNDTHGHLFGDRVIRRVATLVSEALRAETDFAARFGGEEFVVLLDDTNEEHALIVAERIRTLVEIAGSPAYDTDLRRSSRFVANRPPASLLTTVSCGVATVIPNKNDHPMDLIARADQALYRAKSEGRNRVCCHILSGVSVAVA